MIEWFDKAEPGRTAFVESDTGRHLSYGETNELIEVAAASLRETEVTLVFICAANSVSTLVHYLACLRAGVPACLLEQNASLQRLLEVYEPSHVVADDTFESPDYKQAVPAGVFHRTTPSSAKPHPDLALLLTTSGSTGNPKLVRLSRHNLQSNAESIASYLQLTEEDRSIQSLPVYYSYGLSLINSHLSVSASTVLTSHSFMQKEFWADVDTHKCTGFAGVPSMYEFLHRLRMGPYLSPSIRYASQAGGKLRDELIGHFHQCAADAGQQFFVMYGQTEATARIAYVPPDHLPEAIGTLGKAIPGGQLNCVPVDGMASDIFELIYEGPNVMMGYAESLEDLSRGDELEGRLSTGDLVQKGEDDSLRIIGRLKRFAKVYGIRLNLADVERWIGDKFQLRCAACETAAGVRVYLEREVETGELRRDLAQWTGLPPASFAVKVLESLPQTGSGKIDYHSLRSI